MAERSVTVRFLGDAKGAVEASKKVEASFGSLGAIGSAADGHISRFQGTLAKFGAPGRAAADALGGITGKLQQMGPLALAAGAGVVAGVGLLAAGAVKGVQAFVSLTAEVRALQRVTGATAQESSKLGGTLRLLGIDTAAGEKAFGLLSKTIANTPEKLTKLGIEITRNKNGNVNLYETLLNVGDAYKAAGKGAEGNAIALGALGRGGLALLPILGKSREELEAIGKSLEKKGLIFDQAALEQGRQFTVSMRELGESTKGLEIQLARGLVPILTSFATAAAGAIDGANKLTKPLGGISGILEGLLTTGDKSFGGRILVGLGLVDAKSKDVAASEKDVADAFKEAADAAEQEASALDKLLSAQVSLIDTTLSLKGSQLALDEAQVRLASDQKALTEATRLHGAGSQEAATAADNLEQSYLGVETAASRLAHQTADMKEQQALANGETFTAEQKTKAYKDALLEQAAQIGGPIGAALTALANQIKDLPENKTIAIQTAGVESARAELAGLATQLRAIPGLGFLGDILSPTRTSHAHGTITTGPEIALIGEDGPEAVIPLSANKRDRAHQLLRQSGLTRFADGGVVGFGDDNFVPAPGDDWRWSDEQRSWVNFGNRGSGPATAATPDAAFAWAGGEEPWAPVMQFTASFPNYLGDRADLERALNGWLRGAQAQFTRAARADLIEYLRRNGQSTLATSR